jgi:hypothetical protein
LGVTLFGLFLTPVFFVTVRWLTRRWAKPHVHAVVPQTAPALT